MRNLVLLTAILIVVGLFQILPVFSQSNNPPFVEYLETEWVDSVYQTLSQEEKIAQLIHIAAYSNRDQRYEDSLNQIVEKYQIGGLIFFQGDPASQALLTNRYQKTANVPLLISMDAEWGLEMRLDSTIQYPYNMTLGAIQDNNLIYDLGAEYARQAKRLGVHINFAPVVDVNNNPNNPVINFRAFGSEKENVAAKGLALMKGMQNHGLLAVAKHFPGHGDTDLDSHLSLPVIRHNRARLDSLELYPFQQMIEAGVGGVMVAHLNIPALDTTTNQASTLSGLIVDSLLTQEMEFEGMIFTDALNMKGVTNYYEPGEVDAKAFLAGNDALLFSEDVGKAIEEIQKLLNENKITEEQLENRVRKALALKYWSGLSAFEPIDTNNLTADLNTGEAKYLNRKLYEHAVTLLQNNAQLIPVQDLTQSIATLAIGSDQMSPYQQMLGNYVAMDHFNLPKDAPPYKIDSVFQKLNGYDLIIAGLEDLSMWPGRNYGVDENLNLILQRLVRNKPVILSIFGNAYALDKMVGLESLNSLLLSYQNDPLAQEVAAQIIFGGIGAKGKLPVDLEAFKAGTGMNTEGGYRVKYTVPEAFNLDSHWIEYQIDSIMKVAIDSQATPGAQILFARDGEVFFRKNYGFHTYDSLRPVENEDLYDFASITKISASLPAIMKLDNQNVISLEEELSDYLPQLQKSNKEGITLMDALTHQGRLTAWIPFWKNTVRRSGKFKWYTFKTDSSKRFPIKVVDNLYIHRKYDRKIYKAIRKSKLRDKKEYVYSDLGFYLYPLMVERLTGQDFYTYLQETFYKPLGASTLTFNPRFKYPLERIVPTEYDSTFRKALLHGTVDDEGAAMLGGISGHAGLFGTGNDLMKLMQMYIRMGFYGGKRYISADILQEYTECQFCEEGNRRGIGFDKPMIENTVDGNAAVSASTASFGHSGFTGTFTWADPENDLVYVFMSNRVHPSREHRNLYRMNVRTNIQEVMYQALEKSRLSQ